MPGSRVVVSAREFCVGVEAEGHVGFGLGEFDELAGSNEDAGRVAGVDGLELAGRGLEEDGDHGDEGALRERFGEVDVEILHDGGERGVCTHGGVGHHVEAGGDECGGETFAADVGDGEEDFAAFADDDVDVIAADPFAGDEADGEIEGGDLDVAGDEAFLDGMGLIEFAFDGGVGFAEFSCGPGGFGLLVLFDGEDGEGEPFGGAELGGEDDVEHVGVCFFALDGDGDGGDGHHVGGDGELRGVNSGGGPPPVEPLLEASTASLRARTVRRTVRER